ncbi:MAG: response regulator, partial [Candidatus Electrothrix sp. AR1]|nr:response regulator [Candidatus Electrothrix sp. AR1]
MYDILLIDDDSMILSILRYILENEQYRVVDAQNAQDGLRLAKEKQPPN